MLSGSHRGGETFRVSRPDGTLLTIGGHSDRFYGTRFERVLSTELRPILGRVGTFLDLARLQRAAVVAPRTERVVDDAHGSFLGSHSHWA